MGTEDEPLPDISAWATPAEAVEFLKPRLGSETARSTIVKRIRTGQLQAAAVHWAVMSGNRKIGGGGACAVNPEYWDNGHAAYHYDFWVSGDVEFDQLNQNYREQKNRVHFQDLRFDPVALAAISPIVPVTRVLEGASKGRPSRQVSEAEARRWMDVLIGVHGTVTESFAIQSAKAMFPDAAISRDKIRELLPERKPGRPASGDKNRD